MFHPLEGMEVSFADLTIVGPTTITGEEGKSRFDSVYLDAAKGAARAYRCRFSGFTSALRVSSSVNWPAS
jgi:hypothetical protein